MSARLSLACWPAPLGSDVAERLAGFMRAWAVDLLFCRRGNEGGELPSLPSSMRVLARWEDFQVIRRSDACSETRKAICQERGLDLPSCRIRFDGAPFTPDGPPTVLLAMDGRRKEADPREHLMDMLERHDLVDSFPELELRLDPRIAGASLIASLPLSKDGPLPPALLFVLPRLGRDSGAVLVETRAELLRGQARPAKEDGLVLRLGRTESEPQDQEGTVRFDSTDPGLRPPGRRFHEVRLRLDPERRPSAVELRNTFKRAQGFLRPGGRLHVEGRASDADAVARALERSGAIAFEWIRDLEGEVFRAHRPADWPRPIRPLRWIDDEAVFERLCLDLAEEELLGLDVETAPWFTPGALSTIQLSTPRENFVIDALALKSFQALRPVLERARPVKVIHFAAFEQAVFRALGLKLDGVLDTWAASRALHPRKLQGGHGLAAVCQRELGRNLDKACQVADWCLRPLPPDQLDYAAIDSEVLVDLWSVFGPRFPSSARFR